MNMINHFSAFVMTIPNEVNKTLQIFTKSRKWSFLFATEIMQLVQAQANRGILSLISI